jgi:hypothetical protein
MLWLPKVRWSSWVRTYMIIIVSVRVYVRMYEMLVNTVDVDIL